MDLDIKVVLELAELMTEFKVCSGIFSCEIYNKIQKPESKITFLFLNCILYFYNRTICRSYETIRRRSTKKILPNVLLLANRKLLNSFK